MTSLKRGLIVVLDGLGDRPIADFGGATPLEAASTPVLDAMVAAGSCGLVDPLAPGIPVGTATGTSLLLGLRPADVLRLSRGPVEAAGVGLDVRPGDVAMRCNFATLERRDGRLYILDRRAGRILSGTSELAEALAGIDLGDGISADIRASTHHRAVLRLAGPGLSAAVTDTDPGDSSAEGWIRESRPQDGDEPGATRTAVALNRFVDEAYARLTDHPVNQRRREAGELPATGIITRGAGTIRQYRSLLDHLGMRVAAVAGDNTVRGVAGLFRFTMFTDPRFTALPDTDVEAKVRTALGALQDHDLVYLHFKGADIGAHDLDPESKRDFIERVDAALAPLLEKDGLVIGVSGDHSTDSNSGRHTSDPLPSLIYGPGIRQDRSHVYGETECGGGGLGRITTTGFLACVLDAMDRTHHFRPSDWKYVIPG